MKMLLVFLLCFYGCDTANRSKEVKLNFSKFKKPATAYIEKHIATTGFNGKVYCSVQYLGADSASLFLNYLCQEFYLENGMVNLGTGVAGPIALYYQTIDSLYIRGHQKPRDGGDYQSDVNKIFPRYAKVRMQQMQDSVLFYRKALFEKANADFDSLHF